LKTLVVGAGGLGSYVGAVLARAGHETVLLARGAHAQAISADGLEIRTPEETWRVRPGCVTPSQAAPEADLVILAVKSYSLDDVAPVVRQLAERGALVLSLLNGVDVSERMEATGVPGHRIIDGVAYLTAFRTAPGYIERKGRHQRLVIGSSTGAGRDALIRVREAFAGTGVAVETTDDIGAALWSKMAVVCSLSVLCGMTGSAIGPVRAHPLGASLQARAIREVLSVGRATGVGIPADAAATVGGILDGFPDDFYPSVLHDLRSGRRTEMEHLAGAVARIGLSVDVPTPLADAATCVVALVETRMAQGEG
jgi:2-dehydropantoate 2-reductase